MLNWSDLRARPQPRPDRRIAYGPAPLQRADLWLPAGPGPHPVVLMLHGGCWQSDVADRRIMGHAAADLRAGGIAVWNVDYRGIDRPGGGYPGTFRDVATAADALRTHAPAMALRTDRVVAIGHSAGAALALWLAARPRIAADSPLHTPDPLPIATAISIGGLPDLVAVTVPPGDGCGGDAVHRLVGFGRPDPYADTSPAALLPFATPQILIDAAEDGIAPPAVADAYCAKAAAQGIRIRRVTVPKAGHIELIAPGTAAWGVVRAEIMAALGLTG